MDYRSFEVESAEGADSRQVEFCWLQTAISLRHSDTVDVKFTVDGAGKIVALPHAALEQACRKTGVPLTDDLCLCVAGEHLRQALATGEDAGGDLEALAASRVEELVGSLYSSSSAEAGGGSRSSASKTFLQSRHST